VFSGDAAVKVFIDLHDPGRLFPSVAADRHEINLTRKIDLPNEICSEHERTFEHADKEKLFPAVISANFFTETLNERIDCLTIDQRMIDLFFSVRHRQLLTFSFCLE
jgi:hypothetical protein